MRLPSGNNRTGLIALSGALAMLGLGYASVPLYRLVLPSHRVRRHDDAGQRSAGG